MPQWAGGDQTQDRGGDADLSYTRSNTSSRSALQLVGGFVRVIDGADRGKTYRLGDEPAVIGSGPGSDVVLHDRKVSRRHLAVSLGRFGFEVEDLGSRNGTLFEGARVARASLVPGAIIRVGDTHLVLMPNADDRRLTASERSGFGQLVGDSLPMRQVYAMLERLAGASSTVLLLGETGTGKELAARALHEHSERAAGPFEVFDCGAVSPGLIGSDLFGHVRGAFTGAVNDRPGLFERGNGGTVFIDEIAELPLDLQTALLRLCDRGEICRIGSTQRIPVDVRIVAATRRDLAAEVVAGRFREDLYYRLSVVPVMMPALRDRLGDLPALCTRILEQLGVTDPGPIDGPGLAALMAHRWPGNVRELRNVLERAVVNSGPTSFRELVLELPAGAAAGEPEAVSGFGPSTFQAGKREAVARYEREYLAELMRSHKGNISQASATSGIERTQLKRLLRRNGLL